jgi:hypothetical protein
MDSADRGSHANQFIPATMARSPPHITPPRDGVDFKLLDGQHTGGSKGSVAVASRVSVQRFCSVVSQFGQFKRMVALQTGFGGITGIRPMQKINLRFSAWTMGKVDPATRVVRLDHHLVLPIGGKDLNNLFGLPSGGIPISQVTGDMSPACLEYTRIAESISVRGTHSLKAAETVLLRELDENSTQLQIDCFKIALVIFAVGHLLCPSAKHDYTSVDYWAALQDPARIAEHDWSEYVLQRLMDAVRKFKADMMTRHSAIHLVGCHLFLQVHFCSTTHPCIISLLTRLSMLNNLA